MANQCENGWGRGTDCIVHEHTQWKVWLAGWSWRPRNWGSVTEQPVRQASSQIMNTVGAVPSIAGAHTYIMLYCTYTVSSFIIVLRQDHSFFHNGLSTDCGLVLPLSIYHILCVYICVHIMYVCIYIIIYICNVCIIVKVPLNSLIT